MMRIRATLVLAALWVGATACDTPPTPLAPLPPTAPAPLSRMSGVNLFHLEPTPEFDAYLENQELVANSVALGWNTFRLPIEWDDFVHEDGSLDDSKIERSRLALELLISRLKQVSEALRSPIFLILDFHQYKFGRVCGGVGIPNTALSTKGLNERDANCVFKAFHLFWANQSNIQGKWIAWALAHLQGIAPLAQRESGWLRLGIEPINEPQFGKADGLFGSNPFSTVRNLKSWIAGQGPQKQIDGYLIPFYRKFIAALESTPFGRQLVRQSSFVAEPFVFDHIKIQLGVGPLQFELKLDGRYQGMLQLQRSSSTGQPIRWIAGPHHYLGAMDPGLLDALPLALRRQLSHYPNAFIDRDTVHERIEWVARRMHEAGMRTFFGEWGTQTTLLDSHGHPGGHADWIRDSQHALDQSSLGALWWQYRTDPSTDQNGFYLLRSYRDDGTRVAPGEQLLKCGPSHFLAQLVFGRCR